jgi:lipopolysaccharide export system permease protein
MRSTWRSIGSLYILGAAFAPLRNTFLYVVVILECVRLKLIWSVAIHQPNPSLAIIKYLVQWLPLYVGMALQISLAVGVMMGLAKISRSRELDALHALGFSLHQLLFPVIVLTMSIMAIIFVILGWLQPLSIYYSKVFIHEVQQSSALISDGTDMFRVEGKKTLMLDNISRDGREFGRVFIYENYPDGKAVTTAGTKGHLTGGGGLSNQHYFVNSLDVMEVTKKSNGLNARSYTISHSVDVQGPLNEIGVKPFRQRGESEYEWTLNELLAGETLFGLRLTSQQIWAEINYRFAQVMFILLLPFIAVTSVVEPRRNPGPLRFLIGLLIVLGFNQYLGMATSFSRTNADPLVAPGIAGYFHNVSV